MNTPHRRTDTESVHLEIDELVKLDLLTAERAQALKARLTPTVIEEHVRNGMRLSDIIELHNELLNIPDTTVPEPHVGMLFVTDWKAPWQSRPRKGRAQLTIWHEQTVLCKVTRIDDRLVEYDVLTILKEGGRPPTGAPATIGGAYTLDALRTGRCTMTLPTPEQLAMLPATERGIGSAVADPEYRIPELYARGRLTLEHTGGGCTGLALEFTCGLHALVTSADDASAPTTEREPVDVGVCNPENGTDLDYRRCDDAAAAMSFLQELSVKYSPRQLPDPTNLAHDALIDAMIHICERLGLAPGDDLGRTFPDDRDGEERIVHALTRFGQSVIYGLLKRQGVIPHP